MKTLSSLLIFALSLVAHAAVASPLTDELVGLYQKRMSTLDRDLVVFRYQPTSKSDMKTMEQVQARVRGSGERFFNKAVMTGDMAGPGVYVAVDPFSSRSFGGSDPQMFVLTIKKGARVLDISQNSNKAESELLKKIYNDLQCLSRESTPPKPFDDQQKDYLNLRKSSTEACREAAIQIATQLGAQALIYSYTSSNSVLGCRDKDVALNVVSTDVINLDNILFYSDRLALEPTTQGAFVKKIYQESAQDFSLLLNANDAELIPASLDKKEAVTDQDYKTWKKSGIYGCGPKWSFEKGPTDLNGLINRNFRKYFSDKEIQNLLVQLTKAYKSKAKNQDFFALSDVKAFNRLSFKASGLPQDEATFLRWLQLSSHSYEEKYQADIRSLFGIETTLSDLGKLSLQDEIDAYIKSLPREELRAPDFYLKLLAKYKITGGYAMMNLNTMNVYKGGIILSSVDPQKSFLENIEISRQAYKSAITTCLNIYTDPNMDFEAIKKSECAVVHPVYN